MPPSPSTSHACRPAADRSIVAWHPCTTPRGRLLRRGVSTGSIQEVTLAWARFGVAHARSPAVRSGHPCPPLTRRCLRSRPPGFAGHLRRLVGHGQPLTDSTTKNANSNDRSLVSPRGQDGRGRPSGQPLALPMTGQAKTGRMPVLASRGKRHPCPFPTWSTAGKAEVFLGRQSPLPAAARKRQGFAAVPLRVSVTCNAARMAAAARPGNPWRCP